MKPEDLMLSEIKSVIERQILYDFTDEILRVVKNRTESTMVGAGGQGGYCLTGVERYSFTR